MAISFAAAAGAMGAPIAKFLLKRFLGEGASAVGEGLISIASSRIESEEEQRIAARVFEDLSDKIVKRLLAFFSDLDDDIASVIAVEIARAIECNISLEILLAKDLNAVELVETVKANRGLSILSPGEEHFFETGLNEAVRLIIGAAQSLPNFDVQSVATVLSRITRMSNDIEKTLDTVVRLERLVTSAEGEAEEKNRRFEADYRAAVIRNLDFLELFGADISVEAQRHALTVGYVSLNISEGKNIEGVRSHTADRLFNILSEKKRILIRGHAGSGKSTLFRWLAIRCAEGGPPNPELWFKHAVASVFDQNSVSIDQIIIPVLHSEPQRERVDALALRKVLNTVASEHLRFFTSPSPRDRIPFLVRLRDCKDGRLPSPQLLPTLIAQEIGSPPVNWVSEILRSGKALILFDGVDEIPNIRRKVTQAEIEAIVQTYPKNWYVVSSRPTAVREGWLSGSQFSEMSVMPMSDVDREHFIRRWHDAVQKELSRQGHAADLGPLASELIAKLNETPAISRLASNPLLCAVLCALHRDRHRKLPDSQSELCEAMCHLLLHRRDVEAGIAISDFAEEYRNLTYEQKRSIVQEIAYFMVRNEESAISESDAVKAVGEALKTLTSASGSNPKDLLRSLIERSGVLREQRPGIIDFVHNTIKEYLAADSFVSQNDFSLLAKHANADNWRQVVLFAAATRDKSFATNLVRKLLELSEESSDDEIARRLRLAAVDCRSAALHLDAPLVSKLSYVERDLIPPKNMTDAEALASSGDQVVPLLRNKQMRAREAAACVRCLRLVGTPLARRMIDTYINDERQAVVTELCQATNPLRVTHIKNCLIKNQEIQYAHSRQIVDLRPLAELVELDSLVLWGVSADDISPLASLKNLFKIWLPFSNIRSIAPLHDMQKLVDLDVSYSPLEDLGLLSNLPKLEQLDLSHTMVSDISPFVQLRSLRSLKIQNTAVRDISLLERISGLQELNVSRCPIQQPEWTKGFPELERLDISYTGLDLGLLASKLPKVTFINISGGTRTKLFQLRYLSSLNTVVVQNVDDEDADDLIAIPGLTTLIVRGTITEGCEAQIHKYKTVVVSKASSGDPSA